LELPFSPRLRSFANISSAVAEPVGPGAGSSIFPSRGVVGTTAASAGAAAAAIEFAPVAPDQWPYDKALIAALLSDEQLRVTPVTIGIADGALGDRTGRPLPSAIFDRGPDRPDDNDVDDDDNTYVDDAVGAGMPRPTALAGSGDVGLCSSNIDYSVWTQSARDVFSHGTVVSSIASALSLRRSGGIADRLPRIVFFRMLSNICAPDADYTVKDGELATAFDYLQSRSKVINISYTVDRGGSPAFVRAMKDTLPYYDRLLVLPAGNDTPGDLDINLICPACLGNETVDSRTARRVLVVGAATRQLRRASFSNYGENTVRIFAPGEPADAIDLTGSTVPSSQATTSYAAPYVALAAGLMQSLGITEIADLRDRLVAASWPLNDPPSRPEVSGVGVLDLTKAAAVQHDAIEVIEEDRPGEPVRRTYVGSLTAPLREVGFCAGRTFPDTSVHAIRLSPPSGTGARMLRVYWRNRRDIRGRRLVQTLQCRPSGDVTFKTLGGLDRTFPLAMVTQVQVRWIR
jgi:hypothetical protein